MKPKTDRSSKNKSISKHSSKEGAGSCWFISWEPERGCWPSPFSQKLESPGNRMGLNGCSKALGTNASTQKGKINSLGIWCGERKELNVRAETAYLNEPPFSNSPNSASVSKPKFKGRLLGAETTLHNQRKGERFQGFSLRQLICCGNSRKHSEKPQSKARWQS